MSENFNLATATGPQMKAWAANNIDLKLTLSMNETTMREKIIAKCGELGIDPPTAVIQTKQDKHTKTKEVVTINVAKTDKPGGTEPVFVGVQGVGYLIPRAINVDVSPAIVEVLRNAVTDNVTQDDEGELHHDEVQTYPFSIVEGLHEAA